MIFEFFILDISLIDKVSAPIQFKLTTLGSICFIKFKIGELNILNDLSTLFLRIFLIKLTFYF